MSRKHADLPNQIILPFMRPFDPVGRIRLCADTRPSDQNAIRLAACGQDDGPSRPLANANAGRMAGLRDTNREAWFVDDDADEPDPAT
ncbi:MAG TPA: hypothetical protein VMZ31_19700 [Phycisphaerae bacterium]|nr:hypothetical protein [Phycisphaerae bacterium]